MLASRIGLALYGAARFMLRRVGCKARPAVEEVDKIAREIALDLNAEYERLAANLTERQREAVETYLGSPELQATVRQLISLRLLYGRTYRTASEQPLAAIGAGIRMYLRDQRTATQANIAQMLLGMLQTAVDRYVEQSRTIWKSIDDVAFHRFLTAQEEAIPRTVDAIAQAGPSRQLVAWIERYAAAASDRFGRVRAPHWDSQVIVPIEQVYIPARMHTLETLDSDDIRLLDSSRYRARQRALQEQRTLLESLNADKITLVSAKGTRWRLDADELDAEESARLVYPEIALDRTVVVGDPGAGKTTLATRVAADVLRGRTFANTLESAPSLPFVITLREYETKGEGASFAEYIGRMAAENFQARPPDGLIEMLLLTGRAMVIFDGLDELVDTAKRQQTSEAIEAFAAAYINTPILVTSRHVGYDRAPLDPRTFSVLVIDHFTQEDVSTYVDRWYQLDESIGNPGERHRVAQRFLKTTGMIADLRSNPLLLALLCNLYKATGFQDLPRSRPAVLEKCSLVLFDRWDRHRRIGNVDFERDFEPVVAWLAYHLMTEPSFARGITESRLIELATEFLHPRFYETESHARAFARSLIRHSKDRAWVITDVGTTEHGESLYQFTHRTFLEYYTALFLYRRYRVPDKIMEFLLPQLAEGRLGLVPLLTVQIMAKRLDDAADEVVTMLAALAEVGKPAERVEMAQFGCDVLRCLPVGPRAIRSFVPVAAAILGTSASGALPKPSELPADSRSTFEAAVAEVDAGRLAEAPVPRGPALAQQAAHVKRTRGVIDAIRFVREHTGLGLAEARSMVMDL